MSAPQTIIDKLWSAHEIARREDGAALLFVDRHYVHEGSFLAFDQMRKRGGKVAEPALTFGIADHYVPTRGRDRPIADISGGGTSQLHSHGSRRRDWPVILLKATIDSRMDEPLITPPRARSPLRRGRPRPAG